MRHVKGGEVDVFEGLQCTIAIAVLIKSDKPLVHRTKDDGRFGAPAVGVAVNKLLLGYE